MFLITFGDICEIVLLIMLVLPFWSIIGFAVFASGKGKFWGNVWNSLIDLFDFISKSKYLSDLKKGSSGTNLYDIVKREFTFRIHLKVDEHLN